MYPGTSSGSAAGGQFNTTRWSLIVSSLASDSSEGKARDALAQLCRIYWRPIFAFVCRQGHSVPDAQDITQDFFLMILQSDLIKRADRNRGRFRTLLLTSLQNFMIDAHDRTRARKRGGGQQIVSWDEWMAEAPSQLSIPATALGSWPAEKIFDVRWAATVAEHALHRLQEECERHGRRRVFDILSSQLTADRGDISYEALARELGVETPTIKRLLHQMRQRYGQLLREEVAGTVDQAGEVDDELRYLMAVLASESEEPGARAA